jgi:DNA-3-methyladenine glycosylase I
MQAGLSWITVLKKRAAYRKTFHQFDPEKITFMTDEELENHLKNPDLIRNRLKMKAIRTNARVFLEIQKECGSFSSYMRRFVEKRPLTRRWETTADIPTSTPESLALSKDLKNRGMTFVGPTIIYAFMQAVGMVNDHEPQCWVSTQAVF